MDASQAIADAIRQGVPLFNKGDAAGCYRVYRDVSTSLVRQPHWLREAKRLLQVDGEGAPCAFAYPQAGCYASPIAVLAVLRTLAVRAATSVGGAEGAPVAAPARPESCR